CSRQPVPRTPESPLCHARCAPPALAGFAFVDWCITDAPPAGQPGVSCSLSVALVAQSKPELVTRTPTKKTDQAGIPLSRFRDLLPSRHRRAVRHRASGFIASE